MSKSSIERRADLNAALKRFKKGETISLEDCALLWGVTKARFINIRVNILDFPDPIGKQGNAILYPARPAIEALIKYETRNDQATAAKSSKIARILGNAPADGGDATLPASEMLSLARTRAEVDKQMREQGLLVRFDQVQQVAVEVFGEISATLSKLSDVVDPNGRLEPRVRDLVDAGGKDTLLRLYNSLNNMLGPDAHISTPPATPDRKRPSRARKPVVRKGPKGGVGKRARRPATRRVDRH